MKKYENPEIVSNKYELDESIAALESISGIAGENNVDTDDFNNMFGQN